MEPVDFINNKLNSDERSLVFSSLTLKEWYSWETVCKNWRSEFWGEIFKRCVPFGSKEYKNYFDYNVEQIDLPSNINDEIIKIFRFSIVNGVEKSPLLVLIPPRLTLKKIGEFVKPFLEESENGYSYIEPQLLIEQENENSDTDVDKKPYWVLMTNGGVGRNENYEDQKNLLEKNISGLILQPPTAKEAVLCIYANCVVLKSCEFDFNTYTRTQNEINGYRVVVGGFGASGLHVHSCLFDGDNIAVAGLRKFSVLGPCLLGS